MPLLKDLLSKVNDVKLKPTATVVRTRDGSIKVERQELLSDVERQAKIQASQQAAQKRGEAQQIAATVDKIFPISPGTLYEFYPNIDDNKKGAWLEAAQPQEAPQNNNIPTSSIKVVTFNIWFDHYEWKKRTQALLDLVLRVELADIVCLQEVTVKVLMRILQDPLVRSSYRVTDCGPNYSTINSYGVVMLIQKSLIPTSISWQSLPTTMGRKGLIATFGDNEFAIATVHLESLNNARVRTKQLQILHRTLANSKAAILLGDLNITATGPYGKLQEHQDLNKTLPDYQDAWVHEHGTDGDHDGATNFLQHITFDSTLNSMLKWSKDRRKEPYDDSRLDRVLCRSTTTCNTKIIGNTPIGPNLYVSDHYGLSLEVLLPVVVSESNKKPKIWDSLNCIEVQHFEV